MENNLLLINANLFISLSSSAGENFESLYVRNFVNEIYWEKKKKRKMQTNNNNEKHQHQHQKTKTSSSYA